jgi:ABC-type branched-subunit amino acid transport system ATPase component/ABC-type branched-subunit amino acid transport system permease subunit
VLLAKLVLDEGLSWWTAFPIALGVGVATGLLTERFVVRPLRERGSSPVILLLASIGVAQLLAALPYIPVLGPNSQNLTLKGYPLPFRTSLSVGGVVLTGQYVLVLVVVPTVVAALALFLKWSNTGRMIRAAASNPDAARLAGISIGRVSMITWGVAGALSAVTAVVQAPSQPSFDASMLGPDLLLRALGAAAVGGFTSLPAALVGGLAIGLINQIALHATGSGGAATLVVFASILVILLVRSDAISNAVKVVDQRVQEIRPLRVPHAVRNRNFVRHQWRLLAGFSLFVALLLPQLPVFRPDSETFGLNLVLIYALVGVSLTMVVGWAGQVSLGHFALVGVGAFLTVKLSPQGVSLPLLLFVSGALGATIMVAIGIPALRIRGLTLAITTLGFAVIAPAWLFNQPWIGSARPFGIQVTPPGLGHLGAPHSQAAVYYVCLTVLVLALVGAHGLRRSLPGRIVLAVRDNESAAMAFGVTPATVKLGVLAFSGFLAAMAGVLWAIAFQNLGVAQFNPALSLSILAVPVIGGLGSLNGAIGASVLLYGLTFFLGPHLGAVFGDVGRSVGFQLLLAGIGQLTVLLAYPTGLAGYAQRKWEAFLEQVAEHDALRPAPVDAEALVVEDLQLAFGGVRALDHVSIRVQSGEIVGLIGPNGAGKSTLLNAISGALPASGQVLLFGTDVTPLPPDMRWALGLGRSFQDARLFPSLTVAETIQLALRNSERAGFLAAVLRLPWVNAMDRSSRAKADDILDRFGLRPYATSLVSELSTGTRRICDLAAQVAAHPRLLLLDEPTAGVAQREAEVFPGLLRRIRDELGCAIVIVEHDLPLLMHLCDRLYAMESGQVIAEGTAEEVRGDPRVIASYLGTNEAAVARSGGRSRATAGAGSVTG